MKKTVKSLIVAASVAAVAGIGAVSFAAWNIGNTSTADKAGTTGTLTAVGDISLADNLTGKTLVPYDQTNYDTGAMENSWEITVTPPTTTGYTYAYKVAYKADETNDLGGAQLYVYTGETALSAVPESGNLSEDWKALTAEQTVTLQSDNKIYIVLKSADHDNHHAKNFGVTVTCTGTATTTPAA